MLPNTWVQLVNNATSTAYVSTAASDANGLYTVGTAAVPVLPGTYTVKTGPTNVGPWTATGDNNYLVPSAIPAPIDVRWFGAKCDAKQITDGAITSGTAILTSVSSFFSAADVGKTIYVPGAGPAGALLTTTVLSFQNTNQITLAANASTTVNTKVVDWGTDDTAAIQAALDALGTHGYPFEGGIALVPAPALISSKLVVRDRCQLVGIGRDVSTIRAVPSWPVRITTGASITSTQKTLTVPGGTYTAADVSKRIRVSGAGAAGGNLETWVASVQSATAITLNDAAATTVTGTGTVTPLNEMITIGGDTATGVLCFGARVENLTIDANNVNGLTCASSQRINEQSGVFRVLCTNFNAEGVRVSQSLTGQPAQHYSIDDVELYPSQTGITAATRGLWIDFLTIVSPVRAVERVTVNNGSGQTLTTAVQIEGSWGRFSDIHVENTTNGVVVGSVAPCGGAVFMNITGKSNVTNLLVWSNGSTQNSLTAIGLQNNAGTNTMVDQINTVTIPTFAVGFYAIGDGTAGSQPILTSDVLTAQRFAKVTMLTGSISFLGTSQGIIAGPTSFVVTNNAANANNISLTDAGALTVRNGLTLAAGSIFLTAASTGIVAGPTSFAITNNAASFNNLQILDSGATTLRSDLVLGTAPRLLTSGTIPTVGSGGAGTSALSILTGSTNSSGRFQVTLTAVAPGVVAGVVAFGGGAQATAPLNVVCSLSAPTAGVASPPIVGADTFTTSGFTVRVYGPTTVTTGTYVINYWVTF